MKQARAISFILLGLMAGQAQAAKVLNLDHVPHRVMVEQAGAVREYTIQPNGSVRWVGTDSTVSLVTPGKAMPSRGRIHSDGLLSGTIGSMRNQQMPAGPTDEMVIWPGGQMHMQRRMKFSDK